MRFNDHTNLVSRHAFLSGSNHHWINYTEDKLQNVYRNSKAKEEGVEIHELASLAIQKKVKLAPKKKALNMFVNDAIEFDMDSEQVLYYSDNCFGTADAIAFRNNLLQIHDLKTGVNKVSFAQLDIYASIFCLEYRIDPYSIRIEERIYQGNDIRYNIPEPDTIAEIMNKIILFDRLIVEIELG